MRGSLGLGLVIGLVVGAGAMYLALRPPWAGHGTSASDAAVVAAAPADAGVGKPGRKKRVSRKRPGGGGGGNLTSGDESGWGGGDTIDEAPEPQLIPLTPADRALEWRGDDTSRGPQKIDMNGGDTRSLDDGEIQSTISSQSGPAQSCVMQAAANTNLAGTVSVKMVVDGKGHVTKSKVQAPHYMFDKGGLLGCMRGAVNQMHFPATGASTLVTMPINFN